VTIRDAGNLTVTSNVGVTVNAVLTTIGVTPASASVGTGLTQSFSATAFDQFGLALSPPPAFTWSVSGGGTISATGLFTAGASAGGPFTVTAASAPVSGTASVTVTPVNAAPTIATAAAATPSPVIATTTSLSALGADDAGEAALTYTWATTGAPPAAVTFSANGTNAAKNVLATFTRAGSYTFQVTIRDAGNLTVTSNVGVVVSQTVTTITVAPASASVVAGGTQAFSASAFDQFAQAVSPSPSFTWGVTGGGTISASGLFSAGATAGGPFTVTAAAAGKSGAASVSVTVPAAGPASFRTLEEAVAETKPDTFTVIEIHDNGPLFVAAMPALAQRSIVIRGAPGFHPLLVWEMPKKTVAAKALPPFLSLARGKLILDNLDFVAQVSAAAPVVVFDLPESDFCVRSCTFSLAGKAPSGVALVRRIESANPQGRTRTWLQRTFVRGADVTLLDHQGAATEAMIEESLVAGQVQPLFRIKGREDDEFDLRCLRSTLVCGQVFLRWQAMTGNGGQPTVRGWMLDSIVSRDDTSGVGDLIQLADGADPSRMRWRAQNSVYAGWKQLLASGGKSIGGHDLDAWHRQWIYSDGDRAVVETWPANPPPVLEEQPADAFLPGLSPVAFTALTGPGTIGCVAGWLPAAPESWTERLYEPRNAPSIPLADLEPPRLETSEDGFYHGERLDLNKVDLGAHLNAVFQKKKPAPRIVLHLTGRGVCSTSPIRIKGVQQLVLYGDPSKDAKDPFVLEVNSVGVGQPLAAIEMIGGNLELIGIRVRLHALTLLPAIAHVQNGDLTLTRCQLQGPLFKPNETFQGVITISNAAAPNASLVLRDNVLMSGKVIVHMQDHVQLRARNNLLVSLGDAFVMEGNRSIGPATHVLDHNTFAVRQHALTLRTGPEFHAAGPVFLHAASNAFLAPFADSGEPRALLRGSEPWVSSGRWAWQGRYNVYDARLSAYLALTGAPTAGKQTMRDWQKTWGQTAEFEPYLFDVGAAVKTIAVDTPVAAGVLPTQLDRLTLPRTVRGDPEQEPPGADLWSLGVIRKKG